MERSFPKPSPSTAVLLLLPLFLLILIVLVLYPHESELQSLVTSCRPSRSASFIESATPKPNFRLFIGILTLPDHYERRHLLRLVYSLQPKLTTAHVDIRFVFCNLTNDDQHVLIALEIMRFDDILILDCAESMDDGKTYAYFSSLPKLLNGTNNGGGRPYDYVMKADDDIYIRLQELVESLRNKPREDVYYGRVIQCYETDPYKGYMSGMGYVLSWDLVEWIATSEMVRNHTVGPEDRVMAGWLKDGERGKNRFNEKPAMYNYPEGRLNPCMHEFMPDTVAVHQLKDNSRWARTLKYFNVTHAFKPSTLYHIP
ncbi:hydroxyproline O-galactosyltransferase GALT4-like [Phoenix dactylifera]|uniref:Hexosyltransferase n=1 Tax=Phoenix dactylifera TaxID=42345 RepID=A0A8B7CWZ0_PHODC|nr:hydroxyproline O-galactosyltransferase GALT4-like [Phoenix dactylifera]